MCKKDVKSTTANTAYSQWRAFRCASHSFSNAGQCTWTSERTELRHMAICENVTLRKNSYLLNNF